MSVPTYVRCPGGGDSPSPYRNVSTGKTKSINTSKWLHRETNDWLNVQLSIKSRWTITIWIYQKPLPTFSLSLSVFAVAAYVPFPLQWDLVCDVSALSMLTKAGCSLHFALPFGSLSYSHSSCSISFAVGLGLWRLSPVHVDQSCYVLGVHDWRSRWRLFIRQIRTQAYRVLPFCPVEHFSTGCIVHTCLLVVCARQGISGYLHRWVTQ